MPSRALGCGLLFFAVPGAFAARNQDEFGLDVNEDVSIDKPTTIKSLVSAENVICGGPEIWNMLSASSSVSGIRSVKWLKIDAIAEDYLEDQKRKLAKLEIQLSSLSDTIEKKKEQERPSDLDVEEIGELIEKGLVKFGSLAKAKETKCGKPGSGSRAPRGAYKQSMQDFEKVAEAFFSSKDKRLNGDLFHEECEKLLPPEDNSVSYCGPLCQRFRDVAQTQSDAHVGEKGEVPSDELVKRHAQKMEKKKKAENEVTLCTQARQSLLEFSESIKELKQKYDKRFEDFMDAEMALEEALDHLQDSNDNVQANMEALEEAEKALTAAEGTVKTAEAEVEEAKQSLTLLHTQVQEGEQRLFGLRSRLEAARTADTFVVDMKAAVSAVMLKMKFLYTQAILEPMNKVGLLEDLDLDKFFSPSGSDATDALGEAVDGLSAYCKSEAPPIFAAVKESLDLTPLCEISEASIVKKEAVSAVEAKSEKIKKQLGELLGLHNLYSKKMTKERAENRVSKGEPAGWAEISRVFSRAEFFRGYLNEWRLEGKYLKQAEKLGELVKTLTAEVEGAQAEMTELGKTQEAAAASVDKAIAKLEEAEAAHGENQKEKGELEGKVEELKARNRELKANVDKLEALLAKAKEEWKKAEAELVEFYSGQVSLVEVEEEPPLHAARDEAHRRLRHLRHQVAEAKAALLEVEAIAAEAGQ